MPDLDLLRRSKLNALQILWAARPDDPQNIADTIRQLDEIGGDEAMAMKRAISSPVSVSERQPKADS